MSEAPFHILFTLLFVAYIKIFSLKGVKLLLHRFRAVALNRKRITQLSKLSNFLRFSDWMSAHSQLSVNDYPAKGNVYKRRYLVHEYVAEKMVANEPVNYLEFGVADCETFYWWLEKNQHPDSRFFGFDTFTGLPEDWGNYKRGTFSLGGEIPTVNDSRASLYKGLFQDTLHEFLSAGLSDNRKVILLDADLYSSTLFVLTTLAPHLRTDDILIFDEFNSPSDEFRALEDFLSAFSYIRMEPFGAANNYACVGFKVTMARRSANKT